METGCVEEKWTTKIPQLIEQIYCGEVIAPRVCVPSATLAHPLVCVLKQIPLKIFETIVMGYPNDLDEEKLNFIQNFNDIDKVFKHKTCTGGNR